MGFGRRSPPHLHSTYLTSRHSSHTPSIMRRSRAVSLPGFGRGSVCTEPRQGDRAPLLPPHRVHHLVDRLPVAPEVVAAAHVLAPHSHLLHHPLRPHVPRIGRGPDPHEVEG